MNAHRFLLSTFVTLLPILAAADESRDRDGQYFCVVEHVAGVINTDMEGGLKIYSGNINLPENDLKFFIKVGPRNTTSLDRQACEEGVRAVFEKGFPYKPALGTEDRKYIGLRCFTSDEIIWKSLDGRTLTFQGYGGFEYYGYEPETWFELYRDAGHTFHMGLGGSYQGPVVETGHCIKIEPPK